ncbi:MAG: 50S ribosomal protein L9 [Minisyncoccota bacterium]
MKVILTKDVKGVGRAHETVAVFDGYALNYLIPKNLAIFATPSAAKEAHARERQSLARKELAAKLVEQNLAVLAQARIVLKAKANEKGHLYDAVGEPEIVRAVKEQAQVELPEHALKLEKPIKELGTFAIPVASGDSFGTFSILIEAEA